MKMIISLVFLIISQSGCASLDYEENDLITNSAITIVIQKLDKDIALVGYPATKTDYGFSNYEKVYYVKDKILRNYADEDEIPGYRIEKIQNKTYTYTTRAGYERTISCGQLVLE